MAGLPMVATISDLYYNRNSTWMELRRHWGNPLGLIFDMCKDAEQQQYERQEVKEWLDKVQDAVYRTEDVIDEICTDDMNPRLDASHATSQTKKSMVEKLHFRGKLVGNLRFWPKRGRKVEKVNKINMEIIDE
ncbi:putative disease resistance RPP13-like protein 1, partial [Fagus crenata]